MKPIKLNSDENFQWLAKLAEDIRIELENRSTKTDENVYKQSETS